MIKGIYNENEFYTNHYWSSKFFDDLASKTQTIPDLKSRSNMIKELGEQYWDLLENKDASKEDHTEQFVQFYQNLLKELGYSFDPKKRQTLEGLYYSVATEVKQGGKSHLLFALTESNESGSFESLPLELVKLNKEDDDEAEDRDLAEITSEELDSETGPKWFVVGAPDNLHLIQRGKWSYGRFIRVNLSEIFAQKDDKAYTTLLGLFSKEILAPESGLSIHEELDDNSHRHAFAVTTKLREGVRESIELLINEMIYAKKEAHKEYLKKDKDADEYAKELTHDALFYVYRLIFLLFLESQGDDSELLPLKSEIYRHGYSLEKLLEIAFKQIHEGTQEYEGTFIQESLERIFDLIFNGFVPQRSGDFLTENLSSTGFLVKGLKSDLFDPAKVKHLKGVSLRNGILQRMLQKLSMADIKEGKKTRKARVSYANLGINQLGAVYEGLLSYTGFFAKEDLYELTQVKKGKDDDDSPDDDDESSTKATKVDPDKIYLAPKSLVEKYKKDKKYKLTDKHFVLDKETGEPVCYKKGSFIFRMAGRDRQKLASFYTPESLTKCTVEYSLKVLFENKNTLEELRAIKILEPAMGSGAFLNESVNQLSDKILELEIKENPSAIKTPKERQKRLWNIKYELITNNVYGVDLNPTAIELARFSLWLNCIGAGKEPPNFNGHLKIGNSLIGARFKKNADGIYPWLMLDSAMLDYGKKFNELDKVKAEHINVFKENLIKSQIQSNDPLIQSVQRKAENLLFDLQNGNDTQHAYIKLKHCCDLWCSYFFLLPSDTTKLPKTHSEILLNFSSVLDTDITNIDDFSFSSINKIANAERFFHWEIEYAKEITTGGFDLILGNPPWVAVEWSDSLYLADTNPIPAVLGLKAADISKFTKSLESSQERDTLAHEFSRVAGYSKMLSLDFYSDLKGVSKNTYKCFIVLANHLIKDQGVVGLIQEDGLIEDPKAGVLRQKFYNFLRYHFSFINEKYLFSEVNHRQAFSVNILKKDYSNEVSFDHIGNLFLTGTIEQSYANTNDAIATPLIKDSNGNWETKGHKNRIIKITKKELNIFSHFLDTKDTPPLLNLHSKELFQFIENISTSTITLKDHFNGQAILGSNLIQETDAVEEGILIEVPYQPKSPSEVVLSGPHISSHNPLSKQTSKVYKNKSSYDPIDLNSISHDFLPRTTFKLNVSTSRANSSFPLYMGKPYTDHYRVATRRRINNANERSMFACVIPPGFLHLNTISSVIIPDPILSLFVSGLCGSIIFDAIQRLVNQSDFYPSEFYNLKFNPSSTNTIQAIARRSAILNCLTEFYSPLWKDVGSLGTANDTSPLGCSFSIYGKDLKFNHAARDLKTREALAIEIDALTAIHFGLSGQTLRLIYEIIFPVLVKKDRKELFDRSAKLIEAYNFFEKRGY